MTSSNFVDRGKVITSIALHATGHERASDSTQLRVMRVDRATVPWARAYEGL
jgi:hypothetical protein